MDDQGSAKMVDAEHQLFVTAEPDQMEKIGEILRLLDVPPESNDELKQQPGHGSHGTGVRASPLNKSPSHQATYEGKPYSHWYNLLQTEKSESALIGVVDAVSHLVTPENRDEIKNGLIQVIKGYGSDRVSHSDTVASAACVALDRLQPESIGHIVVEAIKGNENSRQFVKGLFRLSLIHISEPTRRYAISYAVFCLK